MNLRGYVTAVTDASGREIDVSINPWPHGQSEDRNGQGLVIRDLEGGRARHAFEEQAKALEEFSQNLEIKV